MSTPNSGSQPRLAAAVAALEAAAPERGRGFRRAAAGIVAAAVALSLALGYLTRDGWFFLLWWAVFAALAWLGRPGRWWWWGPVAQHAVDEAGHSARAADVAPLDPHEPDTLAPGERG